MQYKTKLFLDLLQQSVLIEGVLFRARYLGSTQLVCEGQPTKTTRMMQAEEAVSRIKVVSYLFCTSTLMCLYIFYIYFECCIKVSYSSIKINKRKLLSVSKSMLYKILNCIKLLFVFFLKSLVCDRCSLQS